MPEIFRTRDVVVFKKGDTFSVRLNDALLRNGWAGGQLVMWDDCPLDDFQVQYSDGRFGGFLLWGSDEDSDRYVSMVGQQIKYGYAVLGMGGWSISTRTFERFTYASRIAGPPYVPIAYNEGDFLRISLRGLFTPEDEWTLSGDPRAPNNFWAGVCTQAPDPAKNGDYLGVQANL